MKLQMSICLMFGAVVVGAENQNTLSPSEILLESRSRQFAESMRDFDISPEERASRIEQWQIEQEPLVQVIRTERAARLHDSTIPAASRPTGHEVPPDEAASSDPLLADIHETEAEIKAIHRSIETSLLTPEQRAIQMEQFIRINDRAFAQLQQMKRQVAARSRVDAQASSLPADGNASVPGQQSQLHAEMARIMSELSEVDPETRSGYLEAHSARLTEIGQELLKSEARLATGPTTLNNTDSP